MIVYVVFGLEGLSPIGVWDVLDGGTHDGHGTGSSSRLLSREESLVW